MEVLTEEWSLKVQTEISHAVTLNAVLGVELYERCPLKSLVGRTAYTS